MKWKLPPKIKIYEALGCIADGRMSIEGNTAKVYSSSGNKFYTVVYDPDKNAIMANDNGSYWRGYLGYPAIAFLMQSGVISFDAVFAEALKGIHWKNVNIKFKNDFDKTVEYVHELLESKGVSLADFLKEVDRIFNQIEKLNLSLLGPKVFPPSGE